MKTRHPVAAEVMKATANWPEGAPIVARGLLHLGQRAAIDQALNRLARAGALLRVGRGLYVRPVVSRFGARPPASARVIERLAQTTGETIVPGGASAANQLGLSTQVPVREVYLTSGRSRVLRLGAHTVELRHAPAWQLLHPQRPAGQAIRALAWNGRHRAVRAVAQVAAALPVTERHTLLETRGQLPGWLAQHVSALVSRG